MIKRMLKITGLTLATSTALVSYQTVLAGDVEVSLPTATDAFTVDQPAGTELMRVHGDGNVGIGTSIPSVKLHVVDDDAAYQTQFLIENKNSSVPNIYEYKGGYAWQKTAFDNWNGEPRFMMARSRGTLDVPTTNQDGDFMGQIEFRAYDGGTHRRGASIRAEVDGTVAASNMPGSLHFLTEEVGGSDLVERMVIKNDGNVGIGTDAPVTNLHVEETEDGALGSVFVRTQSAAQTGASRFVTRTATAGAALQLFEANATGSTVGLPNANLFSLSSWGATGVDNMLIGTGTAPIHFSNGNPVSSIKMSILPDGNVGIGTTTPSEMLEIQGDTDADLDMYSFGTDNTTFHIGRANGTKDAPALLDPTNSTIFAMEGMGYDGSTYLKAGAIHFSLDGTAGAGDMPGSISFHTTEDGSSNYTKRMTIKNDGSVGIGVDNPAQKLQVENGNIELGFTDDDILIDPVTGATVNEPHSSNGLYIKNRSTIKGTGAVISLSSAITGGAAAGIMGRSASPDRNGRSALDLWTEHPDGTRQARMTVDYTGNVGIGTTIPAHPLELASGAHVTSAGVWTDASDIAKKENIKEINYGLDTVMKLKPSEYNYKIDGSRSIGFIAQEIEKIIPEVVSGEDGSKGVAYGALTAVLAKAVQQQQSIIEKQNLRIKALEEKIK